MLHSTSKQQHTLLSDAVIMPRFCRLGGYTEEQNPGHG